MRIQFFEYLEENFPNKMTKVKNNGYGIGAITRDSTMNPIVLRDWQGKRIPTSPIPIPDNELDELIKVDAFEYIKGKYLEVKKINDMRNWYSINEKSKTIDKTIKEQFYIWSK